MDLQQRGIVKSIGERLRVRRQGGYSGLDVWLLLLVFFTTGTSRGVRAFCDILHPYVLQLAALAGRRRLPAPASLSRALDAVEPDLLRGASSWLLAGVGEIDEVLRHPVMQSYDACGQGWHVFDLDPTVTTLRHRALPVDKDLPEARRRSEDAGAPGHSGRKRGDIQFRRVTVQHSGSGAWVHAHLSPGNGEGVVDFERALDTVVETCVRLEHPLCEAMVRMDGEYGNVPWFAACRERKLPFITRLNRPKLYEDVEVLELLRSATWYRVPNSGPEPQRAAADLGILTVHPGNRTRRPNGGNYEPVNVRVVASIFPKTSDAKRGRTLDGWQVEFFAVDLPADAWPAAEAIATYFGRTAEENRFGQEDRELGLDRIISYHLPGQELATLVGLSLWNLRLARGFEQEPPPDERPVQCCRKIQQDDRVPQAWPRDPVLLTALAELEWTTMLPGRPGWTWDRDEGPLRCPEGRPLPLTTVRRGEHAEGRTMVIFRRPTWGCQGCSSRGECFRSDRASLPKHAEFSIPTREADKLRARLTEVRCNGNRTIIPVAEAPGPRAVHDSLFLPARARQAFSARFSGASMRIEVELPPPEPLRPMLLADDVADKQRRRKTWEQNVARYALPEGTRISVEVEGSPELRQMLGEHDPPRGQSTRVA
ncbi:MAG: hypothetical protein KKI08_19670 [Armatimonadetes bacterium]|nr:hypothetical protein [Armatimonadota bacterium]